MNFFLSLIVYPNSRLNTLHVFIKSQTVRLLSSLLIRRSLKFYDTHIYYSNRSFIISVTEVTYFCMSRHYSGESVSDTDVIGQLIDIYTLLIIIKGTHVRNDITGLPNMLQFMYVMCMVGDCLRYITNHG